MPNIAVRLPDYPTSCEAAWLQLRELLANTVREEPEKWGTTATEYVRKIMDPKKTMWGAEVPLPQALCIISETRMTNWLTNWLPN